MFKDKDSRDTALLIIMAIITVLFIMYLLTPNKERKANQQTDRGTSTSGDVQRVIAKLFTKQDLLKILEDRVGRELKQLFEEIVESPRFFEGYDQQGLVAIYRAFIKKGETNLEFKDIARTLDRYLKLSFYDLKDIHTIQFPENFPNTLKFKTYLSLFLIRIKEEGMVSRLSQLSFPVVKQLVDFNSYKFLGSEIFEDYQSLPVLFYFHILLRDINVYSENNNFQFFLEKLEAFKDLTQGKYLIKIRELLHFVVEPVEFRIYWEEYDSLNPNDKKTYSGLKIPLYSFLGQKYLVFPDKRNGDNNIWIEELCDADSGAIELINLNIQSLDPNKQFTIERICYSPLNARFVVLLSGFKGEGVEGFINKVVSHGLNKFHRYFIVIDYLKFGNMPDLIKKDLEKFGAHLHRNIESYHRSK